jgi:AraC family transcriptional regulator
MFLIHSMPNVADTPENAAFRRFFYSKWGKENCLISARAKTAIYPQFRQRLSIKCAWGGSERYHIDGRTVAVDDDTYLVLNDGRQYASTLASSRPIHTFSIFFRPGMAEETLGDMLTPCDRLLERGPEPARRSVEFAEYLRPHDQTVTPVLRFIAHHVDRSLGDELWYEEQLSFLLERMLQAHRSSIDAMDALQAARRGTRREVFKRIAWSTDFIHTYFHQPLTIEQLAGSAHLSKYHYIRLFRLVHGVTPYQYLQRKRATAAGRLLETTELGHEEISVRVGFDHRSTLFRQLRRWTGRSGRELREFNRLERTERARSPFSIEAGARNPWDCG